MLKVWRLGEYIREMMLLCGRRDLFAGFVYVVALFCLTDVIGVGLENLVVEKQVGFPKQLLLSSHWKAQRIPAGWSFGKLASCLKLDVPLCPPLNQAARVQHCTKGSLQTNVQPMP